MNCSCVICWVRLQSNHNIIATDCGHIFHDKCLNEWIERSPTCPECRKDVNSTQIRRLYLNFTNDDTIQDDPAVLQEQIDNLQYLSRLHESQILKLTDQKNSYEHRITGLEHDLAKQVQEVRKLDAVIFALEEQLKGHRAACDESKFYREQTAKLKNELDNCRTYLNHEKNAHEHYKSVVMKLEATINQNNAKIEKLQQQLAESEIKFVTKSQEVDSLQGILAQGRIPATPTTSTINNDSILMSTLPDSDDLRANQSPNRSEPAFPFNFVINSQENKENEPLPNNCMYSYFKRKMSPSNSCTPEYGQPNKRFMTSNYLDLFIAQELDSLSSKSELFPTTSGQQKKSFISITDTHLPAADSLSASSALSLSSSSLSSQFSSSSTSSSSLSSGNNNSKATELVDLTGETSSIIIDLT